MKNMPNCLHFVCKMFSYKWTKSLECLKIKKFKLANKVNIINKNVSIRVSIFIFELNYNVYIRKRKGEMKNVECNNSKERKILSIQI